MLSLIIIYWIGKRFYDLATIHNRSAWGYTILGICTYYLGLFVSFIVWYIVSPEIATSLDVFSKLVMVVSGILFGTVFWYSALQYFTKKWENETNANYIEVDDEISNIGRDIES